jgi:hypothetical protein
MEAFNTKELFNFQISSLFSMPFYDVSFSCRQRCGLPLSAIPILYRGFSNIFSSEEKRLIETQFLEYL